jgi:hypothetical protein
MGCGIACVAFLSRRRGESRKTAYEGAKSGFTRRKRASTKGFTLTMMAKALELVGVPVLRVQKGDESPARLRTRTVVLVKRYRGDKYFHYVVKARDGFVDPMDRVVATKKGDHNHLWLAQKCGSVHPWPPGWQVRGYITTKT